MELGRTSQVQGRDIRDLRENLIKPMTDPQVKKYIAECKPRFTPERWEAFKKDVDWFYSTMGPGDYWSGAIKDHGYNPPPVWTMGGKFFGSFGHADDGFFKVLSAIDVLLHLGTVLLLNWAFGWRVMAIAHDFLGLQRARELLLDRRRVHSPGLVVLLRGVGVSGAEALLRHGRRGADLVEPAPRFPDHPVRRLGPPDPFHDHQALAHRQRSLDRSRSAAFGRGLRDRGAQC